jgi:hypothetical protein
LNWGILPVTVYSAILLFVVKEILEAIRKWKSRQRTRLLARRLISDDIERNLFALKQIEKCLTLLERALHEGHHYQTKAMPAGGLRFQVYRDSVALGASRPIPNVFRQSLDQHLPRVAETDNKNFNALVDVADALSEVAHVVSSFVDHTSDPDLPVVLGEKAFFEGFIDYARSELKDSEATLKKAYLMMNKTEPTTRVR